MISYKTWLDSVQIQGLCVCVLGMDPTFNMGTFYATMTTFTYTHVIRKGTNISPTLFSDIMCILIALYSTVVFTSCSYYKLTNKRHTIPTNKIIMLP